MYDKNHSYLDLIKITLPHYLICKHIRKKITLTIFQIIVSSNITAQTVEPSAGVDKNMLQIELESLYSIQKEDSKK